jgi:hypothetical protein
MVTGLSGTVTSSVATLTVNAAAAFPTNGLALWLRADAGTVTSGSALSQWIDQSGNERHAVSETQPTQPTLVQDVLNGRPIVRFDGVDDFLTFHLPVNGSEAMSLFLVAANSQNQNGGETGAERAALFWNEDAPWGTIYLSPYQSSVNFRFGTTQVGNRPNYLRPSFIGSAFTMNAAIKDGTTDSLYVDGTQVMKAGGRLVTIAGCQPIGNLGRGYDGNTYYAGDIAEVMIYNRALTVAERHKLEQMLSSKYGLTVRDELVLFCPSNLVVETDAGQCAKSNVAYSATVSDSHSDATVICAPPSGSTFPLGVTDVTCTATDISGDSSQCSFTVTVVEGNALSTILSITPQGNNVVVITWPLGCRLVLQETTDLKSPIRWTPVNAAVYATEDKYWVILDIGNGNRFFSLRGNSGPH